MLHTIILKSNPIMLELSSVESGLKVHRDFLCIRRRRKR